MGASAGNMCSGGTLSVHTEVHFATMEAIGALIGLLSFGAFGVLWLLMFAFIIAVMVLWVWMLVDVGRRQFTDDNTRLMWVLIIVLAGWIGAIIYYFVGRKQGHMPVTEASPPQPPAVQ